MVEFFEKQILFTVVQIYQRCSETRRKQENIILASKSWSLGKLEIVFVIQFKKLNH